jgi:hypothetical protein
MYGPISPRYLCPDDYPKFPRSLVCNKFPEICGHEFPEISHVALVSRDFLSPDRKKLETFAMESTR